MPKRPTIYDLLLPGIGSQTGGGGGPFADGDTTPSVAGGTVFQTANTSLTKITKLDDIAVGQEVTLSVDVNTILIHGDFIKLEGGYDLYGSVNSSVTFLCFEAGIAIEQSRSVNAA